MTALAPETVAVRPATEADLVAVQQIYEHHVRNGVASFEEVPPDLAEMTARFRELTRQGLPYLVAEIDGTIRGYAYASRFRPRSAYRFTLEDSIYVADGWVGRGIGRMLLRALIDRATALGYRQMIAVIGTRGESHSTRLHAAAGFRTAGVLESVGFKHGRWVDITLMQRPLGDGAAGPLPG